MRKILPILFAVVCCPSSLFASEPKVDSVLFAYYTHCTDIITQPDVLATADTLFTLSADKGDLRMQAVALTLKADHYYFNNNPDSLKAWISRIHAFAVANNDQIRYYYFAWNRLITYYIKAGQYTFAQCELEEMLRQAEKEHYKEGTAQAYTQLGHIFGTKGIDSLAADYYAKAIDYITANHIPSFNLSTSYIRLANSLTSLKQYDKAHEALDLAEKCIAIPDHIWDVKRSRALLYAKTGEGAKALSLLRDIELNGRDKITRQDLYSLQYTVYNSLGMEDKAMEAIDNQIETFKSLGYKESYYMHCLLFRAQHFAKQEDYRQAYEEFGRYFDLYKKRIQEENSSALNEFAVLFNLNRLSQEKAELEKQAQDERYHRITGLIVGQSVILILIVFFVLLLVRFNRRLRQAKQEAESANHMKGLFIQHITHELNTPLNSIIGFSELAAVEPDTEARNDYINIIRTNCGDLQTLVENTLYISDIESSELPPVLAPTDINECCRHSLDRAAPAIRPEVTLRFTPGCDHLTVETNYVYVQQILTNLLFNAGKFTAKGYVELAYTYDQATGCLTFTVTDTGCGIPAAESNRIFERFAKIDKFSVGSGLGLSLCRLAARRLGGNVWLDTSYAKGGSRFIFTAPAHPCKNKQKAN